MQHEAMQCNTTQEAPRRIKAPSENRKSRSSTKTFAKTVGTLLLILLTVFLNIVHTTCGVCYAVNTANYAVPTAKAAANTADNPHCRSHGGLGHTRYMIHYTIYSTLKEKDSDAPYLYFYLNSIETNTSREVAEIKTNLCPENEQNLSLKTWLPSSMSLRTFLPYFTVVEKVSNVQVDINGEESTRLVIKKRENHVPEQAHNPFSAPKTFHNVLCRKEHCAPYKAHKGTSRNPKTIHEPFARETKPKRCGHFKQPQTF